MSVWTFIRCGKDLRPAGDYGEEYETATGESVRAVGGTPEFLHDEDMPGWLQRRGWWGMMQLYNPEGKMGNPNGVIYAAGLDTVFLRDLPRLERALDAVDKDIVGVRCFSRGKFNDMVLRIRRWSDGALKVWDALTKQMEFLGMEHRFVEHEAAGHVGWIPDEYVDSYKLQVGLFPDHIRKPQDMDRICALVFHGRPRPLDVCNQLASPMREVVVDHWGRYLGYE